MLGALEAELIRVGCRLRWVGDGTDRVTWRDILVMLQHPQPDSVLARALIGVPHDWTLTEHLLAGIFDVSQILAWQNSGGKSAAPKPLPRPGDNNKQITKGTAAEPLGDPFKDDESGVFRGEPTPVDELNIWLGWS